ncbi:UNVERIFIED_CONTAM: hypothetical protein Slati_0884100 [Sesamum latifolium]|uniref:Reverse transcriptase domain-containing protein n=1 Tax=Sesamum latifolium TaxID=2727402 RepID=A0AAW2XMS5_9LAMI
MEMLNLIIRARIRNSGLFSFHWRCKELGISMLSFADDLLLFSEADVNSVTLFKDALMEFSDASGLEANPSKSVILLSKSAADMSTSIQTVLNFQIGLLHVKYLGVPINSSRITLADCAPLIAKMDKRLQGWSSYRLSFAARVQLIRSILCSLSVYWSSSFILPKGVIKVLEMKIRQFLWKGTNGTGYAKVSWHVCCLPKESGEQGIPNLQALNQALISKHVWDFLQNKESSIWVQWVRTYKLRSKSTWEIPTASSTWSWKKILSLCRKLTPMLEFQIATGTKFWLWKDLWHPIGILSLLFPRAPTVTDKDVMTILGDIPSISTGEDSILWKFGNFSTSSAYKVFSPTAAKVPWNGLSSAGLSSNGMEVLNGDGTVQRQASHYGSLPSNLSLFGVSHLEGKKQPSILQHFFFSRGGFITCCGAS